MILDLDTIESVLIEYDDVQSSMGEVVDSVAYTDDHLFFAVDYTTEKEKDIRKAMLHDNIFVYFIIDGKKKRIESHVESIQLFRPVEGVEIFGFGLTIHRRPKLALYKA